MTADTVGGVWHYAVSLIRAFDSFGIHVILATMGRLLSTDQRRQAEALPNAEIAESHFRLEWMENPWDDVARAGEWLLDLADKRKTELVHLNSYCHAALPWKVPVVVVAHSCVLSWWDAVRRSPLPDEWRQYAERVSAGLCAADLVVAPSTAMLAELRRLYDLNGPAQVIWNGVAPVTFPGCRKEPIILTVGRLWDEAKNVQALEEVASELPWPIYAAGEDRTEVRSVSIRRLGALSAGDVLQWMARASIYAMPARYEPFGLSILEAALSRCALVLGDIPSLRELWDGAALFVPPDHWLQIARTLAAVISDSALRARVAHRAQKRAGKFSLAQMAQRYVRVYQQLLRSGDSGLGSTMRSAQGSNN